MKSLLTRPGERVLLKWCITFDCSTGLHAILDGNSSRSWLTSWHWTFAYFILVGHQWHGARARASGLSSEGGLSRIYEPVLYMRPID